jgi:hypothetical protein
MKRLLTLFAALAAIGLSGPRRAEASVRLASCTPETTCRQNSNCSFTSMCAYCNGADIIAGGKGKCGAFNMD